MAIIRAQVILHTADAVPENYVTNSWAFQLVSTSGAGALLTPILKTFYDAISSRLSPTITQNNHEIKYSELPGTPPNYPFDIDTFNLAAATTGTAFPDEVALALSFEGTKAAGLPQARRRGRLFLGPFNTTVATANRPTAASLTAFGVAATNLKASVIAIGASSFWGVFIPVNNGWLDNAFDTQRRRGVLPTTRAVWS